MRRAAPSTTSSSARAGTRSERSSNGRIHFRIACRDRRTEKLTIKVQRKSGPAAPYTLEARYAG